MVKEQQHMEEKTHWMTSSSSFWIQFKPLIGRIAGALYQWAWCVSVGSVFWPFNSILLIYNLCSFVLTAPLVWIPVVSGGPHTHTQLIIGHWCTGTEDEWSTMEKSKCVSLTWSSFNWLERVCEPIEWRVIKLWPWQCFPTCAFWWSTWQQSIQEDFGKIPIKKFSADTFSKPSIDGICNCNCNCCRVYVRWQC